MMARIHATSRAVQRKRQTPRACSRKKATVAFMGSEHRLRHDHHVAGLQWHVLVYVTVVHEVGELHVYALLLSVHDAYDARAVAGSELAEAANREDCVEDGHPLAVGYCQFASGNRARIVRIVNGQEQVIHVK